jgi:peptidoglycan DL-endopeptidase CwlO
MSIGDVTSRITSIQSQLALLGPQAASATSYAGTSATAAGSSAASFASVLNGATDPASIGSVDPGNVATEEPTTSSTGLSGDAVVADAKKYLGIPYLWGGTDPAKGLDCSGLVQNVYHDFGVDLPRVSRDQAQVGTPVASLDEAQPGDLLAFGSPVHHIAIYAGDGQMVEAPHTGANVRVTDVYETPTAIRRVIGSADGTSVLSGATAARSASTPVSGVPYADVFNQAASTYGVSAQLLAAVAKQESGYDPNAVSGAGAQGLMQLMPSTASGLGVTNSFDPTQAVDGAAKLLSGLLDRFNGSTPLALAAYNAGPGAVMRYGGVPPYAETQNYVKSIMAALGSAA